jgi:SAM-dependent methyltransferase
MDYNSAYETASTYSESMTSFSEQVRDAESAANGACFNRSIAASILQRIPAGRHLDLGMGNGFLLEVSRKAGHALAGIDVSEKSLAFVEKTIPSALVKTNLADLDGTFSITTALEVIEHVANPLALLKQLSDRLDQGGLLVLSVPNVERPYWRAGGRGGERKQWLVGGVGDTSPHHLTRFSATGMRTLLSHAGFTDVHVDYTPLDVVTWLLWDLEVPMAMSFNFGLRRRTIPLTWFQRFLMERIVLPYWRRDESLGYGLMAIARKGDGTGLPSLASLFESTRENVVQRHLERIEPNLAKEGPRYLFDFLREALSRPRRP